MREHGCGETRDPMSALPCPVVDPFAAANQAYATICRFRRSEEARQVDRGWSQIYMAEKLGIDRSYLSELESGKIEPCLRNLELIADGFGIAVDVLLRGIE